jgi:hypothetical protein
MIGYSEPPLLSTLLVVCALLCPGELASAAGRHPAALPPPETAFSCPSGTEDVMQYFVMDKERRAKQFLSGTKNPIYTEVFPDEDFAARGYWFWLKSPSAHGFDVDVFDEQYVYLRSTELTWKDNTTFKRKAHDVPLAPRCVAVNQPAPEIRVRDARFEFYSSCTLYKTSSLGTIVNRLDPPVLMDTEGNLGQVWTRVLHYRYNCDTAFDNCKDEEQFFLGKGFGQWQWRHYRDGELANTTVINQIGAGTAKGRLPCPGSYQ